MPRPLSQEARHKAVEAAQVVLAEHGIAGFTLDRVAKDSGVAKTTLYRHWGSASVLMLHSIDCLIERVPTPNTGSLRGDLLELMTMFIGVANDPTNRQLMLDIMHAAGKDPELAAAREALVFERTRPLRELVQRAIDRGEIAPIDLEQASTFIEGPLMARMLKSNEPIKAEDIQPMVELVARGLGAC